MSDPRLGELPPDDHPIDTVPAADGGDASAMNPIVGALAAIAVFYGVTVPASLPSIGPWITALGALAALAPAVAWHLMKPRARLLRALRSRAPDAIHGLDTAVGRGTELTVRVTPGPETSPFDPADPAHLDAAEAIRRCRVRDGAALDGADGRYTLRVNLDALADLGASRAERLDDWLATLDFLGRRADPRAAWLAAIACTERTRWRRAELALTLLARDDRWADLRARVLEHLAAGGPRPARTAAALARVDLPLVDRLLEETEVGDPADGVIALLELRWRLAPDPATLGRWVDSPALRPLLARLPLKNAGVEHWRRLVSDGPLEVAVDACETALGMGPPVALPAARALLDRADLRARMPDKDLATAHEIRAATAAIDHLGGSGDAEDLRRLGAWSAIPGPVNRRTKSRHGQLKLLAGNPETAGGLALAATEGVVGGLSRLEVLRGELSPAEAAAAAEADHSGSKAKG